MSNIYSISIAQKIKEKNEKEKKKFFQNNKLSYFKKITESRKDELYEKAFLWNEEYKNYSTNEKMFNLYYYLNNSKKNFENDESFLFLIFTLDPELKLLKIFYEESKFDNIKRRFEEEFGYTYDKRLLILEKVYNNRFPSIIDEFSVDQKIK